VQGPCGAGRGGSGLAAGWPTLPLYRARWGGAAGWANLRRSPAGCQQGWKFRVCLPWSTSASAHAPAVALPR